MYLVHVYIKICRVHQLFKDAINSTCKFPGMIDVFHMNSSPLWHCAKQEAHGQTVIQIPKGILEGGVPTGQNQ